MKLTVISNRRSACRLTDTAQQLGRLSRTCSLIYWGLRTGQGLSTLLSTGLALNVFLLHTCRAQPSPLWWAGVGSHSSVTPGPASPTLTQQFLLATPPRSLFPWCACPVGSCRTAAAALRSSKVGRHGAWDWGRHKRSVSEGRRGKAGGSGRQNMWKSVGDQDRGRSLETRSQHLVLDR